MADTIDQIWQNFKTAAEQLYGRENSDFTRLGDTWLCLKFRYYDALLYKKENAEIHLGLTFLPGMLANTKQDSFLARWCKAKDITSQAVYDNSKHSRAASHNLADNYDFTSHNWAQLNLYETGIDSERYSFCFLPLLALTPKSPGEINAIKQQLLPGIKNEAQLKYQAKIDNARKEKSRDNWQKKMDDYIENALQTRMLNNYKLVKKPLSWLLIQPFAEKTVKEYASMWLSKAAGFQDGSTKIKTDFISTNPDSYLTAPMKNYLRTAHPGKTLPPSGKIVTIPCWDVQPNLPTFLSEKDPNERRVDDANFHNIDEDPTARFVVINNPNKGTMHLV